MLRPSYNYVELVLYSRNGFGLWSFGRKNSAQPKIERSKNNCKHTHTQWCSRRWESFLPLSFLDTHTTHAFEVRPFSLSVLTTAAQRRGVCWKFTYKTEKERGVDKG
uniref:Uncharacterized protein n=1 Tax=Ditylum brightwellii TaxID=49249 RepID=A0A7S2E6R8_9STRA|mmetsp:Transcript_16920/g.25089  ORF Transcript_16920/g.25089 Transcript_16920/m.25089 type:complete len:107 (+) Transcript_16920:379-699(+)